MWLDFFPQVQMGFSNNDGIDSTIGITEETSVQRVKVRLHHLILKLTV